LLATNDLHYTTAADADAHAALLCVQSGSTLDDPKRFKFDSNEFYVKTPAQMRALFADFPEASDNTLLIAQRADVTFDESANYMPIFPVPEGESEVSFFEKEVTRGLIARYPQGVPERVKAQADYEIGVISQMGFASYFFGGCRFHQLGQRTRDSGRTWAWFRGWVYGCLCHAYHRA